MNATTTNDLAALRTAARPRNARTEFGRGSFSTLSGLTLSAQADRFGEFFAVFTGATWYTVERVVDGWEMMHPLNPGGPMLFGATVERVVSLHGRIVNRAAAVARA